jgi:ABC-2 type transport system ATP-binding protein
VIGGWRSAGSGGATAPPTPAAVAGATLAVAAQGLVKTFGELRAVDDVDLALAPGRIYGLLGPNGSGKTTLIRLLIGLARPTSGWASILGTKVPSRAALARIGYMPQAESVYPELSVAENLAFFAALQGAAGQGAIDRVLELVELGSRRTTPAMHLSGGMRRRLSLACALVHDPPVVFLDEPTVGVDPALRVGFWAHFRRLASSGTTIVVSSHVMDEADRCDRLLLLHDGALLATETPDGLRERTGSNDLDEAFLRLVEGGS